MKIKERKVAAVLTAVWIFAGCGEQKVPDSFRAPAFLSLSAEPSFSESVLTAEISHSASVRECGFYYWTEPGCQTRIAALPSNAEVSVRLTGLERGRSYSYCAFAALDNTDLRSETQTFTTLTYPAPKFEDVSIVPNIYSAQVEVRLAPMEHIGRRGFHYRRKGDENLRSWELQGKKDGFGDILNGLSQDTEYELKAYAFVDGNEYCSESKLFRTGKSAYEPGMWEFLLGKYDIDKDGELSD